MSTVTTTSGMTYIPVKVGRGAAIHAERVGSSGPVCLSIAGHYSQARGNVVINCKKCLAVIQRHEEFLAWRSKVTNN